MNDPNSSTVNNELNTDQLYVRMSGLFDRFNNFGNIIEGYSTDARPAIEGYGTPGCVVTIYDKFSAGTPPLGTATVGADGKWLFVPTTPLTNGTHVFSVSIVDANDPSKEVFNRGYSLEVSFNPHGLTGGLGIHALYDGEDVFHGGYRGNGSVTHNGHPLLEGTAAANALVTIKDGSQVLGTVTADEWGYWSYSVHLDLGSHDLVAMVGDQPGIPFHVTVEAPLPPSLPAAFIDNAYDVARPEPSLIADGGMTDNGKPMLEGHADPFRQVTIFDNGQAVATVDADYQGFWLYVPDTALSTGQHAFTAAIADWPASEPFVLQIEAPVITPVEILYADDMAGAAQGQLHDGDTTDDRHPTLHGTAAPNSWIDIYDNGSLSGQAHVNEQGIWSYQPAGLSIGTHSLTAVSQQGGSVPSAPFVIQVVTHAFIDHVYDSVGSEQGAVADGATIDDNRPVLDGHADPYSRVTIFDNGHAIGTADANYQGYWNFPTGTALSTGQHVLTVAVGDGPASEPFVIEIQAPVVTPLAILYADDMGNAALGQLHSGDSTSDRALTLHGTAEPNSVVYIYDNGNAIGVGYTNNEGLWSFTPSSGLSNGTHGLTAVVASSDGLGAPSESFVIKVTAQAFIDNIYGPTQGWIANGTTTDDSQPVLAGHADPYSQITIFDNGQAIGTVDADYWGGWSYPIENALSTGQHVLAVAVGDGPASEPFVIQVEARVVTPVEILYADDTFGSEQGQLHDGDTTDDRHPTLHGTAAPNSWINIYDNGSFKTYVQATDQGTWSYRPSSDMSVGTHSLTATSQQDGSLSSEPFVIQVVTHAFIENVYDGVGPEQGSVANGATTDDSHPVLAGHADPYSQVTIFDNGQAIGTVVADYWGGWSYPIEKALSTGQHVLTAAVGDGPASEPFVIQVEARGVTPLEILYADDTADAAQGQLHNGDSTDDRHPTLHGTAEPNSVVYIYDNGSAIGVGYTNNEGLWSFTPSAVFNSGTHDLTAVVAGPDGLSPPSASFVIQVVTHAFIDNAYDRVGPEQGSIANGATTDDSHPVLAGHAEPYSQVTIFDNGQAIGTVQAGYQGDWTYPIGMGLSTGQHVLTVAVGDGPTSEPFVIEIQAQVVTPLAILYADDMAGAEQGQLHSGDSTDDRRPTLHGTAEPNSVVYIYDNGSAIGVGYTNNEGLWSFTPSPGLNNGTHALTAVVAGADGLSPSSEPFVVQVITHAFIDNVYDGVGPEQGWLANGATTDDSHPVLAGHAEPYSQVTIFDNGQAIGTADADYWGNWNYPTGTALSVGQHVLTVAVGDGPASEPFVIQVEARVVTPVEILYADDKVGAEQGQLHSGDSTDDRRPTLHGTAETNSYVNIYDNSILIGTRLVGADGHWSFTPSGDLSNGMHGLTAAVDSENAFSQPFVVQIDGPATPPYAITGIYDVNGELYHSGDVMHSSQLILTGTARGYVLVAVYDENHERIGVAAATPDGWELPVDRSFSNGEHRFTVEFADGTVSQPFVITVDNPAAPDAKNDSPAMHDVLTHGGEELFSTAASHDDARLAEHDMAMEHAGPDAATANLPMVAVQNVDSVHAGLVLPNDQPHVHVM
ncbi:hypothetical protein ISP15_01035 [Dyella jejuensis]|uniref:Bacterial Ig-like domain-containing protein n=1 Tax=Dyella jejuensis TaxID=1432009 RepID=A0ABW8JD28_9GAMM